MVLSDFLTDEPVAGWRQSARRHRVMALRLVDPREEALPSAGLLALEDAELGTRRVVDAGSLRVRDAYARAALERRSAFRRNAALPLP